VLKKQSVSPEQQVCQKYTVTVHIHSEEEYQIRQSWVVTIEARAAERTEAAAAMKSGRIVEVQAGAAAATRSPRTTGSTP